MTWAARSRYQKETEARAAEPGDAADREGDRVGEDQRAADDEVASAIAISS